MTPAEAEVRRRIGTRGRITFAEFMDVALYWPRGGYYLAGDPFGAAGDYYTSPMTHPCFGSLLAVQLFQLWQLLEAPARLDVVELGSGNGVLCRDLLAFSASLSPEFRQSLRYVCVDPRAATAAADGLAAGYQVAATAVPFRGLTGCVLSNEYLDAFPVHVVERRRGRLLEVFVTVEGGELGETLEEPSASGLEERLSVLGVSLADGQRAEMNLSLSEWAGSVAAALERGYVLTVDYGRLAEDLYSFRERPRGTLTTLYHHTQTDDPFRRVGLQDISAQVDFRSVMRAGEEAGLETLGFTTQGRFLGSLGSGLLRERIGRMDRKELSLRERRANLAGMEDLVRPGGLGDFKVLVQGKNVPAAELWGLAGEMPEELDQLLDESPPPLLGEGHIRLAEGRWTQPEQEFELMELWPAEDEEIQP